ncbi:T9SS type A sorting domain-containing protein [Mesonia sp. MT50]|uniref:T9SS type A sorting domain-containing protein n=1 Tax=Mesonia profundi TaxID=3070998 RepID=A0ABU0ZZ11_9FLAO|nr:T9SS type A sorting domain-containing protein [Mesonia profundi]MDQ7916236.1 T9SS type A sorting domain-containing protein [Mesonia profundi]
MKKNNGDKAYYNNKTLSIKEVTKSNFSLFPNPVQSSFQVKTDVVINSIILAEQEYHIENLPNGIYFVRIHTSEGDFTQQLLKN